MGLRPAAAAKNMGALAWECLAHRKAVVVLPSHHALAKRSKIELGDLKSLFFVAMSEETHPGSRDWLSDLCQQAGFTPGMLQDVALESGLMTFVAEGLGASVKADYWIAWHREHGSKALEQYIEIVKLQAGIPC